MTDIAASQNESTSPRWKLNRADGREILTVAAWSMGSAIIALALNLLPEISIPEKYALLVPVINTALYAAKKFIDNHGRTLPNRP